MENDDSHTCLAVVLYNRETSHDDTNTRTGGLDAATMQGNQLAELRSPDYVESTLLHAESQINAWSQQELWRAAGTGTGTTVEFFEDGPFTRDSQMGRTRDKGNFVVLSYLKVVSNHFTTHYNFTTQDSKEFYRTLTEGKTSNAIARGRTYESMSSGGWRAATPLWAAIATQPNLVKSNTKYIHGLFWKKEHPLLLSASWTEEQAKVIATFLSNKDSGVDNASGGDISVIKTGDDKIPDDKWVGSYVPEEASAFDAEYAAAITLSGLQAAGGGLAGDSGGATVPVGISRAVQETLGQLFPRKRPFSEVGLDTSEPLDEQVRPEDQKAAEDYFGDVCALQCDWCDKWRYLTPRIHGDQFTKRAHTDDTVCFQCWQLQYLDGTGCGVTCNTPEQHFCAPNPNDPGESPLALQARTGFLTWARFRFDTADFVVPGDTAEEEDARGEFYREHYWRYLWFEEKILPEGMQGTFGAFNTQLDANEGTFGAVQASFGPDFDVLPPSMDAERHRGTAACPGSTQNFRTS